MRRRRFNKNWTPEKHTGTNRKTRMLNLRAEPYFKYDMKEILEKSKMDQNVKNSLIASITSKATRVSIESAKDFVKEKEDEGMILEKDIRDALLNLLDKYGKWR